MSDRVPVPQRVAALGLLDRVDYGDAFRVVTQVRRTPEQWARLALSDVSPLLRGLIRRTHRMLGLRLRPAASPDDLLGWTVLRNGPDEFVLGADGGLGSPRIVILTSPGQIVFATIIRFGGTRGRLTWAGVAPLHRAVARYLLDHMAGLDPVAAPTVELRQ